MDLKEIALKLEKKEINLEQAATLLNLSSAKGLPYYKNDLGQDILFVIVENDLKEALETLLEGVNSEYLESHYDVEPGYYRENGTEIPPKERFYSSKKQSHYNIFLNFDLLKPDNFGKNVFDIAFQKALSGNTKLLDLIVKNCDFETLIKLRLRGNDGKTYNVLDYYLTQPHILPDRNTIIGALSKSKEIVNDLDEKSLYSYLTNFCNINQIDEEQKQIISNLMINMSANLKGLNYFLEKSSIDYFRERNMHPKALENVIYLHKLALQNGGSINLENINDVLQCVTRPGFDEKLGAEIRELYAKPLDIKSAITMPKCVVEAYFDKDYEDVIKAMLEKADVKYELLKSASNCEYDNSRLTLLTNLGVDVNLLSPEGKSIFAELSPKDVIQMLKCKNVKLEDQAVLDITSKSYLIDSEVQKDGNIDISDIENVYRVALGHVPLNNADDFYKNMLFNIGKYLQRDYEYSISPTCIYKGSITTEFLNLINPWDVYNKIHEQQQKDNTRTTTKENLSKEKELLEEIKKLSKENQMLKKQLSEQQLLSESFNPTI